MEFEATTVGRIERGTRGLDVVEFVLLSRAIGVDPLELLGRYLVKEQQARLRQGSESPAADSAPTE